MLHVLEIPCSAVAAILITLVPTMSPSSPKPASHPSIMRHKPFASFWCARVGTIVVIIRMRLFLALVRTDSLEHS